MKMEKLVTAFSQDMITQGNDNQDINLLMRSEYSWFRRKTDDLVDLHYFVARKIVKKGRY